MRQAYLQVQTLKQQLGKVHFESMLKYREVLTTAERIKLNELRKQDAQNYQQVPTPKKSAS